MSAGSVVVDLSNGTDEFVGPDVDEDVADSTASVPPSPRSEATSAMSEITTTPPSTRPATIHLVDVDDSDTRSLCDGHRRRGGVGR
jgi:hypothetical protein